MKTLVDVLAEDGVCKDLHSILLALTHATQYLSARIALGALGGILGSAEKQNIQGETQQTLDVIANNLIKAVDGKDRRDEMIEAFGGSLNLGLFILTLIGGVY